MMMMGVVMPAVNQGTASRDHPPFLVSSCGVGCEERAFTLMFIATAVLDSVSKPVTKETEPSPSSLNPLNPPQDTVEGEEAKSSDYATFDPHYLQEKHCFVPWAVWTDLVTTCLHKNDLLVVKKDARAVRQCMMSLCLLQNSTMMRPSVLQREPQAVEWVKASLFSLCSTNFLKKTRKCLQVLPARVAYEKEESEEVESSQDHASVLDFVKDICYVPRVHAAVVDPAANWTDMVEQLGNFGRVEKEPAGIKSEVAAGPFLIDILVDCVKAPSN
eukprot:Platyproteum_vivax@DN12065_c0_g1_i1.p1